MAPRIALVIVAIVAATSITAGTIWWLAHLSGSQASSVCNPAHPGSQGIPAHEALAPGSTTAWGAWTDRILVNSTSNFSAFVLTSAQFTSYSFSYSLNASYFRAAPTEYFWTSGITGQVEQTLRLGAGTWSLVIFNPESVPETVSASWDACS